MNRFLRMSSMRYYLNYWQPRESALSRRFFLFFFFFFWTTAKGKSLRECYFLLKKTNEDAMLDPKRRQSTVSYILKWRNEQIFHSATTTFKRQFKERTQFSIQFMWALKHTERIKKILPPAREQYFLHPLAQKQKHIFLPK